MSRDTKYVGALAFKRNGDPNLGEFSEAVVIRTYGQVPADLSELCVDRERYRPGAGNL